jgi:protein-glucosylgalactosylhydroxylysine glucosidase
MSRRNCVRWSMLAVVLNSGLCVSPVSSQDSRYAAASATPPSATWTIDADQINPQAYSGESVANGMIGIVSAPAPFQVARTLLNGAYDLPPAGGVSTLFPVYNPVALTFSIDNYAIASFGDVHNFSQRLDMKRAVLTTAFEYRDKASVVYTLRALRHLPHCVLLEVTIAAKQPLEIEVASAIATPGDSLMNLREGLAFTETPQPSRSPVAIAAVEGRPPSGTVRVSAANGFLFEETPEGAPIIKRPTGAAHSSDLAFAKALAAGDTYRFAVAGSEIASIQATDPFNEAQRLTVFAVLQGTKQLVSLHERAWAELWRSDIVIQGDDATERDVRSFLYHLYSFAREGTGYSIPPMGLSGLGYKGHIFWDAETWMYPVLLALHPHIARSMLDYRYRRLAAAKRNALAHGYRGAMFPWESATSGDEDTPVWALSGVSEHHITADVGIAAWNYYCVTQDIAWLREKGYPLLKETADFWASRVERNGPGHYDISHVVAADESANNVDDNAFTNAAARANLAAAISAARVLKLVPNADWNRVRKNIPVLRFPNGITREHTNYNGEEIKQADVNLLAYPLEEVTSAAAIRADLAYYKSRVSADGPAMTRSIFAILYARLGLSADAYTMFKESYEPNLRPPFGAFSENAHGGNVYFATGAGGVLQTMLYGFGGLEITASGITQFKTQLPHQWTSLTITGVGPQHKTYRQPK